MRLFFPDIEGRLTPDELRDYIMRASFQPWYLRWSEPPIVIKNCRILRISSPLKQTTEYHGLVSITPYREALRIAKRLEGRMLAGKQLEIRRWHERSIQRDRRQAFPAEHLTDFVERRCQDRRRRGLVREYI